jgi:hypothetical protein
VVGLSEERGKGGYGRRSDERTGELMKENKGMMKIAEGKKGVKERARSVARNRGVR